MGIGAIASTVFGWFTGTKAGSTLMWGALAAGLAGGMWLAAGRIVSSHDAHVSAEARLEGNLAQETAAREATVQALAEDNAQSAKALAAVTAERDAAQTLATSRAELLRKIDHAAKADRDRPVGPVLDATLVGLRDRISAERGADHRDADGSGQGAVGPPR